VVGIGRMGGLASSLGTRSTASQANTSRRSRYTVTRPTRLCQKRVVPADMQENLPCTNVHKMCTGRSSPELQVAYWQSVTIAEGMKNGEGGIRTPGAVSCTLVFETSSI